MRLKGEEEKEREKDKDKEGEREREGRKTQNFSAVFWLSKINFVIFIIKSLF